MANLADDAPAAFARVLQPVRLRNPSGVDAVINRERRLTPVEELPRSTRQRRESAIEADHYPSVRICRRIEHAFQLFFIQRERFLHKHMLSFEQRAPHKLRMKIVACGA